MTCLVQRITGYVANLVAAYRRPFDDRAAGGSWVDDLEARRAAWDKHTADGLADAAEHAGINDVVRAQALSDSYFNSCAASVSRPLQVVDQAAGAAQPSSVSDGSADRSAAVGDGSAQNPEPAAGHLRNIACAVAHYYHLDVFGTEALLGRLPADVVERLYKHIQK